MKLIGITAEKKIIDIVLSDCPSFVTGSSLAHLARRNSELIRINSIVYYDDDNNLCEGDLVVINGARVGVAYYSGGWRVHLYSGENKEFSECEHIYMEESERNYGTFAAINKLEDRSPIRIVAIGEEFQFSAMLMIKDNEIVLNGRAKTVSRDEIFLSTGIYDDDCPIKFGGYFDGGIVCIDKDYDIALKMTNGEKVKLNLEDI